MLKSQRWQLPTENILQCNVSPPGWFVVDHYVSGCDISCTPQLTFTNCADARPGAVVSAGSRGRTNELVPLGASEMNLVSNQVLWAKLCSVSRGFQGGAGGGSCRERERGKKRSMRDGKRAPNILWYSLLEDIYVSLGSSRAFMGNDGPNASFTVKQCRTSSSGSAQPKQSEITTNCLCQSIWRR